MIDLNRIRSLRTLEEMKKDLSDFLAHPDMRVTYLEDLEWSEDDYEADREKVTDLLAQVERRIKSLGNHLKVQAKQPGSPEPQPLETEASVSEP